MPFYYSFYLPPSPLFSPSLVTATILLPLPRASPPTNTPPPHTQCCEGMSIARSYTLCENALCRHYRCGGCYNLDFEWKIISHCDGSEVKDEEWLLWWARYFRGSGQGGGL